MSKQTEFPKSLILGSEVDHVGTDDFINGLLKQVKNEKRSFKVVKLYVELIDRAAREPEIRSMLNDFDYAVPEGVSVQWAAAYLEGRRSLIRALGLAAAIILRPAAIKKPIREKFGGTVFTWKLLEACQRENLRIYLVGTPKHSTLDEAIKVIQRRLPDIRVAGTWPGDKGEAIADELAADLKEKQPDVVFVAMGFPLQEIIISRIAPLLNKGILIGEGGTFDYDSFGGGMKKAPVIIQRIGLEWLWRLILEPSRIKRQWVIPRFMYNVYRYGQRPIK